MRQTQIENMLKDFEKRISALEKKWNKPYIEKMEEKDVIGTTESEDIVDEELKQEEKLIEMGARPAVGDVEKAMEDMHDEPTDLEPVEKPANPEKFESHKPVEKKTKSKSDKK